MIVYTVTDLRAHRGRRIPGAIYGASRCHPTARPHIVGPLVTGDVPCELCMFAFINCAQRRALEAQAGPARLLGGLHGTPNPAAHRTPWQVHPTRVTTVPPS